MKSSGSGYKGIAYSSGDRPVVLVLDDDITCRELLSEFLDDFGCQAFSVADGKAGLEFISTHSPDLILLDLHMPNMDGAALLRELKASGRLLDM